MSRGQIAIGLGLVALTWIGAYFSARAPRKPFFDQYRESPIFQPKGRSAAAVIASLFAGFAALLFFGGRL